ncbi:hypothetical protein K0M31_002153 [Melipona bicolor]|uniref:Uncharacterized protein n=1 Tax=Melipona bicolor TaxID=60889 RepID=A0AA40GH15_9HYME|nr:hypothetical protein K0M31_002153 [Melipona bicolor]
MHAKRPGENTALAKHAESSPNANDPDANPRISQVLAVKGGKSRAGVGVRRRQRGWESREREEENGERVKGQRPKVRMEIPARTAEKRRKLEGERRPMRPQSEHIRRWLIKQFAKRDKKRGTCERAPKVLTTAMPIGRCSCPGPRGNKQVRKQRDRARRGPFTDDRRCCVRVAQRGSDRVYIKRGGKKKREKKTRHRRKHFRREGKTDGAEAKKDKGGKMLLVEQWTGFLTRRAKKGKKKKSSKTWTKSEE